MFSFFAGASALAGIAALVCGKKEKTWISFLLLCPSLFFAFIAGNCWGSGKPGWLNPQLELGDTYSLVSDCVEFPREEVGKSVNRFCFLLKKDNSDKVLFLWAKEPIPKRGIAVLDKEKKMITCIPFPESPPETKK